MLHFGAAHTPMQNYRNTWHRRSFWITCQCGHGNTLDRVIVSYNDDIENIGDTRHDALIHRIAESQTPGFALEVFLMQSVECLHCRVACCSYLWTAASTDT